MAVPFHTQLQPFEEHQSPSPTEERENPYELALQRSTSPKSPKRSNSSRSPTSPVNTTNTLHRQLSGDPENPPPAWQRRPSVSTQHTKSSSSRSTRSPSQSSSSPSIPPIPSASARRHPHLTMTATRSGLPTQLFLHESPNGSSTSLNDDPTLTLPQPAFRRRAGGSSRSSMTSQDLTSLTSEELWALEQDTNSMADMSNPLTRAAERPLDTIRRQSSRIEYSPYRNGLPQDVIWPAAPSDDLYASPKNSRSVTSMVSLRSPGNKRLSRRQSRQPSQTSIDVTNTIGKQASNNPTSPQDVLISSNNSSSTSLASHGLPTNKSSATLSRPPSAYYSRDFLSTLAPREGGYAIAAQMGNGLGAVGTMSVDERRRSGAFDNERPRSMARAPMSKSSGMGRWSIDGGENYGRPYGTASNATTSTSLSMRAGSTSDVSPPLDEAASKTSILPDGALPPATRSATDVAPLAAPTTIPINPSPLSQNTAAADLPTSTTVEPPIVAPVAEAQPVAPTPSVPAVLAAKSAPSATSAAKTSAPLNSKKSEKQLAKEAKAAAKTAEKAAAAKAAADRAQAARDAVLKKQADKAAAKKKKKDDKRKAKEEKERKKAEMKAEKKQKEKSASKGAVAKPVTTAPPVPVSTQKASSVQATPPVQAAQVSALTASAVNTPSVPVPRTQSAQKVPSPAAIPPKASTGPAQVSSPAVSGPSRRTGIFGTLRKRMSLFGDLRESEGSSSSKASTALPPVPATSGQSATQPATDFAPAPVAPVAAQNTAGQDAGAELQRMRTPPQNTSSGEVKPEPLAQLPPRSSSHTPIANHVGSHMTSPQSYHSATMATPTAASPKLGSQISPLRAMSPSEQARVSESHSRDGSPSSNRRNASLRGPRPMPRASHSPTPEREGRDRSESIHSSHRHQSLSHDSHVFNTSAGPNITPSSSGDSTENDSSYSQTISKGSSTGGDLASPFTSDGEVVVDSCKASLAEPEREGSSETVHPIATGIPAGPTVMAH